MPAGAGEGHDADGCGFGHGVGVLEVMRMADWGLGISVVVVGERVQ